MANSDFVDSVRAMVDDDEETIPDAIRSSDLVARRSLGLFAIIAAALGAPRDEIYQWLYEECLIEDLTARETQFLHNIDPSEKQVIDFSWQSERLIVLLWALNLTEIPAADEQCDTSIFQQILPPYANIDAKSFLASAQLRPDHELKKVADEIYNLHWQARDALINKKQPVVPVDIGIIQERHHAINWITGYDGLAWEEVTTDT